MCLVNLAKNSSKIFLGNCHQNNGLIKIAKQSATLPRPQHSMLGCLLFLTDSSNSSTTLHKEDGGGKAMYIFPLGRP